MEVFIWFQFIRLFGVTSSCSLENCKKSQHSQMSHIDIFCVRFLVIFCYIISLTLSLCLHAAVSITMKAWQHTAVIQKMKCLAPRWVVRLVVQNPVPDQQLDWLTPKPWHSCAWCDVQAIVRGFKVLLPEKQVSQPGTGELRLHTLSAANHHPATSAGVPGWEGRAALPPCSTRPHLFGGRRKHQVTSHWVTQDD